MSSNTPLLGPLQVPRLFQGCRFPRIWTAGKLNRKASYTCSLPRHGTSSSLLPCSIYSKQTACSPCEPDDAIVKVGISKYRARDRKVAKIGDKLDVDNMLLSRDLDFLNLGLGVLLVHSLGPLAQSVGVVDPSKGTSSQTCEPNIDMR